MLWIIISILVVVIDQVSKYVVAGRIAHGGKIQVIEDFFYLTLHKNTGAAWGILQNSNTFFLIIIPIISAAVIYFMFKNDSRLLRFSLALILGGAAGNYIDRLTSGEVTDFLLFYIGSYPFPVFNAADIAITCGTVLLAIYMLFVFKEPPEKNKQAIKSPEEESKGDEQKEKAEADTQSGLMGEAKDAE